VLLLSCWYLWTWETTQLSHWSWCYSCISLSMHWRPSLNDNLNTSPNLVFDLRQVVSGL
jgi:hypothetical protein